MSGPSPRMCPEFDARITAQVIHHLDHSDDSSSYSVQEHAALSPARSLTSGDPLDLSSSLVPQRRPSLQWNPSGDSNFHANLVRWNTAHPASLNIPSPPMHCLNRHLETNHPLLHNQQKEDLIMPRVVENQREKFDNDPVFRRLSRESEVRYAGVPLERPMDHRRRQFELDIDRGFLIMSALSSGIHLILTFRSPRNVPEVPLPSQPHNPLPAAEIRNGKLFVQSRMILNGVAVIWNGHVDMETLDGLGRMELDTGTPEVPEAATTSGQR
ncbi:hypothetical protein RvY_10076 [Ramazzottius varieornatus]|uniref:Uncharacterized protein n=1 Tax=Ramazzottius varieornatus TaxID=947166 RepID=A0A1D1VDZ7_RAMVA|nr:hypothetical protein RvY_10076 [Ramazzottius varieornatus]